MPFSGLALVGSYDYRLVALSIFIAVVASYAALDLSGRVTFSQGSSRLLWLGGGATAMGIGIWAMHYIGMLAFHLAVRIAVTAGGHICICRSPAGREQPPDGDFSRHHRQHRHGWRHCGHALHR